VRVCVENPIVRSTAPVKKPRAESNLHDDSQARA
jgi:hypothetical protein